MPVNACDVQESFAAYRIETDSVREQEWNYLTAQFEDANLAQTWAYGEARWGSDNLSHLVMMKDEQLVAAAQVVIRKLPFISAGLAYVKGGPLWQVRGRSRDTHSLMQIIRALRSTYEGTSKLLLRVFPPGIDCLNESVREVLEQEGLIRDRTFGAPKSVFLDLSPSLEKLRSNLKATWRRNLVLAERAGFTVRHGTSPELFDTFSRLYREMLRRKNIVGVVRLEYYHRMQTRLPDNFKLMIMICEHRGEPVAGLAVPHLGNTAVNLLAATGDKGLDLRASYLLQWQMIQWLKSRGCRWYDLDALNHDLYPGISQFKLGLAGHLGLEAEYFGQYESCTNPASRLCVKLGDHARARAAQIKTALSSRYCKMTTRFAL